MLKVLLFSLRIKITYWVNSRLFGIKQIPLIKKLVPDDVYSWGWAKSLLMWLGTFREVLTAFLYKFFYIAAFIGLPLFIFNNLDPTELQVSELMGTLREENSWSMLLQIFFFLTLVGAIIHNDFFTGSMDKYYATELLRLEHRKYTLSNYGYLLLRFFLGYIPALLFVCSIFDKPKWWALVLPLFVVTAKILKSYLDLLVFERTKNKESLEEGKTSVRDYVGDYVVIFAIGAFLAAAYFPAGFDLIMPEKVLLILMLIIVVLGTAGAVGVLKYKNYREFCRRTIAEFMTAQGVMKNAANMASMKNIDDTPEATSDKHGLEYLNDLFVKRHKRILWKSSKRITLIILAVVGVGCLMAILPMTREGLKEVISVVIETRITAFPFILYFINRGRDYTQSLFMNCDHSLLIYPVFKEPKNILKLFRLRLVEISKVNLLPASVLGAGLMLVMFISGGVEKPVYYPLIFLVVTGISIFFSIHYLVMYYLLQPYNAETEVKSGPYSIIMGVTYIVCYILMQQDIPLMTFGVVVILFCVLYSLIALTLAYKLAPRTFKIRQ